jgi:Fe-S-cluster containining protein
MSKEIINTDNFSVWLSKIRKSIQNNIVMEVPCGACRACCTSSLFIQINKNEVKTINKIDKRLLIETPNIPKGNYLLGYLSNGHCPMFKENQCSIYTNRPNTCKIFDCRTFTATALKADNHLKKEISIQSERWRFSFTKKIDKIEFDAICKTVEFIKENKELFPGKRIPTQNSELAILAIKTYKVFVDKSTDQNTLGKKKKIVNELLQELKHFNKAN